jgi:hypothetical protein
MWQPPLACGAEVSVPAERCSPRPAASCERAARNDLTAAQTRH